MGVGGTERLLHSIGVGETEGLLCSMGVGETEGLLCSTGVGGTEGLLHSTVAAAEYGAGTTSLGLGCFRPHFFSTLCRALLLNLMRFTVDLLSATCMPRLNLQAKTW